MRRQIRIRTRACYHRLGRLGRVARVLGAPVVFLVMLLAHFLPE